MIRVLARYTLCLSSVDRDVVYHQLGGRQMGQKLGQTTSIFIGPTKAVVGISMTVIPASQIQLCLCEVHPPSALNKKSCMETYQ